MIVSFPRRVVERPAECRGRVACRKRAQSSAVVAHPPRGYLISSRSCLSPNLENCGPQVGTVLVGEWVATSTEISKVGAGSRKIREIPANADVAQLVEHFTRNEALPG